VPAAVVDQEHRAALTTLARVCFGVAHRSIWASDSRVSRSAGIPHGVLHTG
jgi:hypothetical protein